MIRIARAPAFFGIVALAIGMGASAATNGCVGEDPAASLNPTGSAGQACGIGGACVEGLACREGICRPRDSADTGDDAATDTGANDASLEASLDSGPTTPALVHQTTNAWTSQGTLNIAIPQTAGGNTLVLVGNVVTTSYDLTISDAQGNAWTRVVNAKPAGTTPVGIEIWYAANAKSISAVTVNLQAQRDVGVNISEWSGIRAVSPLDTSKTVTPEVVGASGDVTFTTNSTDLVIAAISVDNSPPALSSASFFALTPSDAITATPVIRGAAAYVVAPAGAQHASWTFASSTWLGGAIALKAQ